MLKGALHIHSNISPDSQLSLLTLKGLFKPRGYDFILTAEHAEDLDSDSYTALQREYEKLSEKGFIMIPGLEVKWKDKVHFLAYGARRYTPNEYKLSLKETIEKIREETQCALLVWGHFNHPVRLTEEMLEAASLVDGIEVFNINYHGLIRPDACGLALLNKLRKNNSAIFAYSGLDLHTTGGFEGIYSLLENSKGLEREAIFNSFREGKYLSRNRYFELKQRDYDYGLIFSSRWVNVLSYVTERIKNKIGRLFIDRKANKGSLWNPLKS